MSSLLLFAQNNGPPVDFFLLMAGVCCGFYLVALIPWIFFLLSLSRALSLCHPANRAMEPGQVWLNLIPFFNYVWIFVTQIRVAESLREEFRDRGWHRRREDYGLMMGVVSSAMTMSSTAMSYCGLPVLLAGFVCWILYWVKIANFNRQLASRAVRYDDDYDDYEDDRPPDDGARDDRDNDRDDRDDDDHKPWERRGR